MAPVPPVVVNGVSKSFRLPREQVHTLKERALHPFRRSGHDTLRALRDVSFAVEPGEFFGIVGRNGSGKSTLLKCLAGIYRLDAGEIYINGRLSTFIELGVGFNMDLAAYDNVMLNATMLGLDPAQAKVRYESIIDFAELQEFEDLKVKNYSSGMLVRLAFAVMIHVDADVLLIDEVLAVGDASFQQKCFDEFETIRDSGRTVILVTHDMAAVRRFCDRALLLEQGTMVEIGDPDDVGNRYLELNFSENARAAADTEQVAEQRERRPVPRGNPRAARAGDGRAEILEAWFQDETDSPTELLKTAFPCTFVCRLRFHADVTDPRFTLTLQNSGRAVLLNAGTEHQQMATGTFHAGEEAEFRVYFGNVLGPDRYHATITIEDSDGWLDRRERFASVMVTSLNPTGALVELPYDLGVHHAAERASAPTEP